MKVRDSGKPDEEMWSEFFDPEKILCTFGLDKGIEDLVDFGCGYGTFTLAAAKLVTGTVYALDIEPEMVDVVKEKCRQSGVENVRATVCDFVAEGTGFPADSIDAALLFNILHHVEPVALMKEALRILRPGGRLAVIHWNYDPPTPRGPAMEIRPRPQQCIAWGASGRLHLQRYRALRPAAVLLRLALLETLHLTGPELPVRRLSTTKATPFEEDADRYDARFQKHRDLYETELEALRSLISSAGKGIETGVGSGRLAAPLA